MQDLDLRSFEDFIKEYKKNFENPNDREKEILSLLESALENIKDDNNEIAIELLQRSLAIQEEDANSGEADLFKKYHIRKSLEKIKELMRKYIEEYSG